MVWSWGVALALLTAFPQAEAAETIPVFTYHTHPPFLVEEDRGLTRELATYLTEASEGRYRFEVRPLSRPGVDKMLAEHDSGIVPWVNPVWFKDREETRHLWTRHALMEDGNAVVSHRSRPVDYTGPEAMKGMTLGGLRGHRYEDIDDYIRTTGELKRTNANNLIDNIRKLQRHRIDVAIMPLTAARYFIWENRAEKELYISPTPHTWYERRLIVINHRRDIADFLERALARPAWARIVSPYAKPKPARE